jgi:hypothetical protein
MENTARLVLTGAASIRLPPRTHQLDRDRTPAFAAGGEDFDLLLTGPLVPS